MEKMYKELLVTFKEQIKVYEQMLKIAKEKTGLVVEGKMAELEKSVKLEQHLVVEIGKLEKDREEISNEIAEKLKIEKADFTISNLLSYLEETKKEEMEKNQNKMLDILDKLKNANELNSRLIKNALEYIDFSINVMTNTSSNNNTYQDKGENEYNKNAKNLFDVKL